MNNNSYTIFYIVRHGETEWNTKGLLQGHNDSPLTKRGEEQARETAKILQNIKFDLAFSSDLLRAKRTIEIIALEKKLAVETTKLLRERNFGKYEGQPYAALKTFDELIERLSDEEKFAYKTEDMESDEDLANRFITFLRETAITHPGKTVLAGTHGGMIRVLLIHLGFTTYEIMAHGKVSNGAYVKLESDGVDFFVKETHGIDITK